ncbi:Smr/MutS family protein [Actinoallomurus rhizosphaericola]|uniref:Smr/MutS family protein n=1 Tax=Actinoallomurus rhizosphaericola TaxID=2952536 RepID=UPI002092678A|nr:Smr/MutS family protein [Actinoallomurus rhizosphaericola]MCO5995526.1 Smr/MutS family protein [Actinoallomurus rhizosphaericola]
MTLTLDLHPIFQSQRDVDQAVRSMMFRAAKSDVERVIIIPGKGSQKLKNRVLALLRQPHLKKLYKTVEPDPENLGRVIVRFR